MESPRKFNDCYFYYYSTCTKGDNCVFRHEPTALGCETMCAQWQQGKCLDKRCKLRHMELRKNRKQIPCYWESQPGGCRKKHCPFQHKHPEARTDGIMPAQPQLNKTPATAGDGAADTEPALPAAPAPLPVSHPVHPANTPSMVMPHHEIMWQQQPRQVVLDSAILGVMPATDMLGRRVPSGPHDQSTYAALPVDPLVVNFEEESDNESAPSLTPTKMVSPEESTKVACGKSQELLLLEQIQAEAAAYYSYDAPAPSSAPQPPPPAPSRTALERRSLDEISGRPRAARDLTRTSLDFKILSLEEIRARKRASESWLADPEEITAGKKRKLSSCDTILAPNKVLKVVRNNSVVYKKLNGNATPSTDTKDLPECDGSRKRKSSMESDILSINDEELEDCIKSNCTNLPANKIRRVDVDYKPKEIKIKLIHGHSETDANSSEFVSEIGSATFDEEDSLSVTESCVIKDDNTVLVNLANEVDEDNIRETIVISDEDSKLETDDSLVIKSCDELITTANYVKNSEMVDSNCNKGSKEMIIDLDKISEDTSNDSITPEIESSLKSSNVPDVVASCHNRRVIRDEDDSNVLNDIDDLLNDKAL